MLKKTVSLIILFFAGISFAVAQNCNIDNLIPKPEKIVMGNANSTFEFNDQTSIVYDWGKDDLAPVVKELDRIAVEIFGKKMKKYTKAHGENNIIFKHNSSLADEAYILEFTPENILISSKTGAGV